MANPVPEMASMMEEETEIGSLIKPSQIESNEECQNIVQPVILEKKEDEKDIVINVGNEEEDNESLRKDFTTYFIENLNTTLANIQLIIISPEGGKGVTKNNNKIALQETIHTIMDKHGNDFVLCWQHIIENLKFCGNGKERTECLNCVIYDLLNTRGRYAAVLNNLDSILKYTKKVIMFVSRNINQHLKKNLPMVSYKHFIIAQKCHLIAIDDKDDDKNHNRKKISKKEEVKIESQICDENRKFVKNCKQEEKALNIHRKTEYDTEGEESEEEEEEEEESILLIKKRKISTDTILN